MRCSFPIRVRLPRSNRQLSAGLWPQRSARQTQRAKKREHAQQPYAQAQRAVERLHQWSPVCGRDSACPLSVSAPCQGPLQRKVTAWCAAAYSDGRRADREVADMDEIVKVLRVLWRLNFTFPTTQSRADMT